MRVSPTAESRRPGQVRLRHVQPSGVADTAIDDGDLPVVSIADRVQRVEWRIRKHLNARVAHGTHVPSPEHPQAPHWVVEHAHVHARSDLRGEDVGDLLGEPIGRPLVVDQMNRAGGGTKVRHQARVLFAGILQNFQAIGECERSVGR